MKPRLLAVFLVSSGCIFGGNDPSLPADAGSDDKDVSVVDARNNVTTDSGADATRPTLCELADCAEGFDCDPTTGDCVAICPPDQESCDDGCIPVSSDPDNCGACDNVCAQQAPANAHTRFCADGTCVYECDEGFADLNGEDDDGCESDCVPDGSDEVCDGVDNDCNGMIDDGLAMQTYHRDTDLDGFGSPTNILVSCDTRPPIGYVRNGEDCDDTDPQIRPTAEEKCDGVENDCNPATQDATNPECAHTVFVTSAVYAGDFSAQGGPDAVCDSHAQGLLDAYGSWRAIVSIGQEGANQRIRQIGTVHLPDGTLVWDAAELFQSFPRVGVTMTESSTTPDNGVSRVWSGSGSSGGPTGPDCSGWTSNEADVDGRIGTTAITANWLADQPQPCAELARLYCINGQE